MGASGWDYFIPYQPDIGKALEELRQKVFQSGDYYKLDPDEQPATIEELMALNETEGTHSILDMERVTSRPDFGTVSPLTSAQLQQLFGTDKPTREMIDLDQLYMDIDTVRERWEGLYIIVYKNDAPDEILFLGFSGD